MLEGVLAEWAGNTQGSARQAEPAHIPPGNGLGPLSLDRYNPVEAPGSQVSRSATAFVDGPAPRRKVHHYPRAARKSRLGGVIPRRSHEGEHAGSVEGRDRGAPARTGRLPRGRVEGLSAGSAEGVARPPIGLLPPGGRF